MNERDALWGVVRMWTKLIRKNCDAYSTQCGEFQQQQAHYMDNIKNPIRYLDNKFVDEITRLALI